MELFFWGFSVRFLQCLFEASPFILTGLFIASVFQRFFGYKGTYDLFGGNSRKGLFRAWVIGMLLPVCSLGVIPIVRQLKKAGLSGGTILAFAMSAPLFNPLSLLYGLTLSEPIVILSFAFLSLLIVTLVGYLYDKYFPDEQTLPAEERTTPYGIKRIISIGVTAAKESSGSVLFYILAGLAGVAMLGAILPSTTLQRSVNYDNPFAPLTMIGIAIPVYATPMLAMSQLGSMFQHANSIGAAFILLILGAGVNLGLVLWMLKTYKLKKTAIWFFSLICIVLFLAYGVEKPLFPKNIEPADHTHAFDIYCQPFNESTSDYYAAAKQQLDKVIDPYEKYSFIMLLSLISVGLLLRVCDRKNLIESWLEKKNEDESVKYDFVIPGKALGLLILVALIAASVLGSYSYYPEPETVFEELSIVKTEALSAALTGNQSHCKYWIEIYDDWTRKLEVGVYLRKFHLSEYHHWKAHLLREKLELLEHEIEEEDEKEIQSLISDITRTHLRMKHAFLQDLN